MHFEKAGNVINCDCSDKIGLAEKILVLVSILEMFSKLSPKSFHEPKK
jgi:hypothetical protein